MQQTVQTVRAPRVALMKLLDGFSGRNVVYIHAPAGFGKTTSTSLWLEHRAKLAGTTHSWLSLDAHDNKTSEFCRRFVHALTALQPENAALRELASHSGFGSAPIDFTLHAFGAFAECSNPCVLVIDDLHAIKNEPILEILPDFIKRLPPNCTVLLLSRAAPPDSFCEMAAKGDLAIVDSEHLQFLSEEIRTFWGKNGRYISNKQAAEIFAATGGWAIALRALLLADEKSYNVDFTEKYLESFFKTHVWERWGEEYKRFMLLVCVPSELTPELCRYLTAGGWGTAGGVLGAAGGRGAKKADAAKMLSELAGENAFLRETGDGTYRFHDLFRDFLLRMLEECGEETVNQQWSLAGDFYYDKKDCFRAVECYLRGKNDDGVAKSLSCMYDYNSPYASIEDTLNTVSLSVTDALVEKHPFLLEVQAWAAYVQGRADDFENYLDKYHKLFPKIVVRNPRSAIIMMLLRVADYRESMYRITKPLSRIPFTGVIDGVIDIRAFTPSITNNQPFLHRSTRDFSELAAQPEKDIPLFEKGLGAVVGAEFAVIKECLHAGFHYEKGESFAACQRALAAVANIPEGCSAEIKFCGMMMLAAALYADNQEGEAGRVLDDTKAMIEHDRAFYLKPNLQAYLCRQKLANGQQEAAKEWLKDLDSNISDGIALFKLYQDFTTARAHIVMGDYSRAILRLQKLQGLAERYRRPIDVMEARILIAIAYWKKGRGGIATAIEYLEQAVMEAEKYGYVQVFASEGAELVNMLHRLQKRAVQAVQKERAGAGALSGEFVKTLYIAALSESKRSKGLTGGRAPQNLSFTDKQKMVMRLMCEGYSRNGIAEKMGLTPNGVKTHVELIYRKLDVTGSDEAIMKIKELGVLGV